jgi:hypothetical protein
VPDGALPNGTVINFDSVGSFSRAQSVLTGTYSYLVSLVVSWLAPDGTVPDTPADKKISLTIQNNTIKAGAKIYSIIAGVATPIDATVTDGQAIVQISSDPEIVVVATKPGVPQNVSATSNDNKQSVVTWTAPTSDGGSAITEYTVTSNTGATCTTALTNCTFTGLSDSTAYSFTVVAKNAIGTSTSSTSASATTAGKPGAPTSVSASSNGNRASTISWTAPAIDGGSSITQYTVTSSSGDTCVTATTSCTISGLSDSTVYTFTVKATNALGDSVSSSSASATTAGIPASPISVSAIAGIREITISWNAPPSNGGSVITGYNVSGSNSSSCSTTSTSCTISGLVDSTSYVFTVTATNAIGTSQSSASASASTFSKPDAPTNVSASSNGEKQSVISWNAPGSDGGSSITNYTVSEPGGKSCTTANTSCTITGLSDATSYTFTVTATNIIGTSDPSTSASALTAAAVVTPVVSTPQAPTVVSVVPQAPIATQKSNITTLSPVTLIGNSSTKIPTIDIFVPTAGSTSKPPTVVIDKPSEKFISEVKAVDGKLVLTPETGFSGKRTVTVTITENSVERIVQIPVVVLPEVVTNPILIPSSSNKSVIKWNASPNAEKYSVFVDGKRVCSTSTTSCTLPRLLGPNSVVEIVSNGGDRTISEKIQANFSQQNPVSVTRLVSSTNTKATLTAVDTKALDKVALVLKNQGFNVVVISEITTTKKTKKLADARIEAIKKYLMDKTGLKQIEFEVVAAKSHTYFNNISVKVSETK